MVVGLLILTTLKTIHSFGSSWVIFIIHFKDLSGAIALNYTAWWLTSSGLMVASIGIYVQAFFCYRLWSISWKNYWVLAPIVAVLLFAYISICLATYYISQGVAAGPHIATWSPSSVRFIVSVARGAEGRPTPNCGPHQCSLAAHVPNRRSRGHVRHVQFDIFSSVHR